MKVVFIGDFFFFFQRGESLTRRENLVMGWTVAAAMQAALPHLDAHLPANTIEALAALEGEFVRL